MILRALLVVLLLAGSLRAAVIETALEPEGEVRVGQRVVLKVTVLVDGWFSKAPRFRLPEVPGLLLLDSGDRPVNTTRGDMSGTIHEFTVIARRPGEIEIPPIPVRFTAARQAEELAPLAR